MGKLARRSRPLQPIKECFGCGEIGPREDWLTFSIEFAQGIRGEAGYSNVPTLLPGLCVCPVCLFKPEHSLLRVFISHRDAVSAIPEHDDRCIVFCRNKRRLSRWFKYTRCPVCYVRRQAIVWTVNEEIPLSAREFWYDQVAPVNLEISDNDPEMEEIEP